MRRPLFWKYRQAFTIATMVPLPSSCLCISGYDRMEPLTSEVSVSRLPATQEQAVINASLWQYVRLREGYTADTAQYAYDLVFELSAPSVRQEYQHHFNYPNPTSPQSQSVRGETRCRAHLLKMILRRACRQIRFNRTLMMDGQTPVMSTLDCNGPV